MPVVLRLMRAGAKKRPFYRVVAADSRRQRDGRFLEILGHYDPIAQPHTLVLQQDRVEEWLGKGAQPSEQVASLLRSNGITIGRPSKPTKKAAPAGTAPKAARKRAVKRAVSPRKARARTGRAKKKSTAAAPKA
jgi:small subunit ribosomal protein S16